MQSLKTFAAAALLCVAAPGLSASLAAAQTCACPVGDEAPAPRASRVEIMADEAPPPLPDYDQPPLPAPGYIWTPGYWAWNSYDYYWVPGTWVSPPRPGYLWTPGYWGYSDGEYAFHRGYWGERVGFYGGVSYGYGYYGSGFEGGRWDGDHFYYNRTVNNFGSVEITNVYEQPAPRIVERASFNGGPDGLRAKPTTAEIAVGKQTHIPPTTEQRQNARVASRTESAFVSTNNGKPPVAATAKPGELKGAAVVPAKASGGPMPERKLEAPTPPPPKNAGEPGPKGGAPTRAEAPATGSPERHNPASKEDALKPGPDANTEPNGETPKLDRERRKDAKPETRDEKLKSETERPGPGEGKPERLEKPKVEREHPKLSEPDARPDKPKTELERPQRAQPNAEVERPRPQEPRPQAERPRLQEERPQAERPRPQEERPVERPRIEAERPRPPAGGGAPPPRAPEHHEAPHCPPGAPNCPK